MYITSASRQRAYSICTERYKDISVSLYTEKGSCTKKSKCPCREHLIFNLLCQNVKSILIKYFRLVQPNIRLCSIIFDLTSAHDMLILPGENGLISVICFLSDLLFNPFICILLFLYPYHPCHLNFFPLQNMRSCCCREAAIRKRCHYEGAI